FFFFQAEDGIRDGHVTGVQTCALPISRCADLLSREARPAGGPDSGLHALLAGARLEPRPRLDVDPVRGPARSRLGAPPPAAVARSEEHTSELQSRGHLVCRLLLEKKKK